MPAHRYRITIRGCLGETGREAFGDFDIGSDGLCTVLTGELDQATLHDALNRIRWLDLELAEVRRLSDCATGERDAGPGVR